MKIIQSFAQYVEGSPYAGKNNVLLNFYSFLLSCITLKETYGEITMYCNKLAYENLIKFLPYDNVILLENNHEFPYWNMYKTDAIMATNGDVIHVDSDVFIFDSLFDKFIYGNYDGIVQDTLTVEHNKTFTGHFIPDNAKKMTNAKIFDSSLYDGRCFSCGVLGVKEDTKLKFKIMIDTLKTNLDVGVLSSRYKYVGAICEELAFYMTAIKHNLKVYEILPSDLIKEKGQVYAANKSSYTHLWFNSKFKKENVDLIKRKIENVYPQYQTYVLKFENMLRNNGIELMYL